MPKKSALGKGLASLLQEASSETGEISKVNTLKISDIVPNPKQPRQIFNDQDMEELTESIKKDGVLQPILVRPQGDKFEIIAGERRYQASKKAHLKEIPAVIREVKDEEVSQLALIENLQRSNLNPIERAQSYKEIISSKNMTQEELAQVLSKSRSSIANDLRLLELPSVIQEQMKQGLLSAGHARAILSVPTEEGRERLSQKVIDENLSVRKTESLAPLFSGTLQEQRKKSQNPSYFKKAAKELRKNLNTNVRVRHIRGRNKIEIEFIDEDDLLRILHLLEG